MPTKVDCEKAARSVEDFGSGCVVRDTRLNQIRRLFYVLVPVHRFLFFFFLIDRAPPEFSPFPPPPLSRSVVWGRRPHAAPPLPAPRRGLPFLEGEERAPLAMLPFRGGGRPRQHGRRRRDDRQEYL